ncbi:MAG: serine hydrolase [Thermomicrobiales bacterium]
MSTTTQHTDLQQRIAERAAEFSGTFGMFAKNLETGDEVGVNADAVMPTASVIKVAVLAELYRQAEAGKVSLEERREVTPDDWWGGSGVLKEFAAGLTPTVNDLARMMIVVSDNVATGMLVRLLGKDAINASLREWGLSETTLIWEMTLGDDIRNYAVSTPRELARLMELIATDAIISPAACAAMRDHLSRQQYLDQIPRYLPYNPYAVYVGDDASMQIFNKTGFYTGVRADTAYVTSPTCRFVIATMTEGSTDPSFRMDHEGNLLNGAAAQLVYEAWRS